MPKPIVTDVLDPSEQAKIFCKYLIGKTPEKYHIDRYVDVISSRENSLNHVQDKFLTFALMHPGVLPYIDAYLAFKRPYGELRYRIYVMFAILESSPVFWKDFLPENHSVWYVAYVVFIGIRAVFRLAFGVVLAGFVELRT